MKDRTTPSRHLLLAAAFAVALPSAVAFGQEQDDVTRSGEDEGVVVIVGERQEQAQAQQASDQQGQKQISEEQAKQIAENFFQEQASANQFEIEAAKLAQERAQDPQLKQIAQTIEQDHATALEALRQQAQQLGVDVSQQPELNEVHQASLDMLKQKQGKEFERAYLFEQDAAHLETVLWLSHVQRDLPNQPAKAYAQAVLPKVKMHTAELNDAASQLSGYQIGQREAQTAGAQMGGEQQQRNAQQNAQQQGAQAGQVEPQKWFEWAAAGNQYAYESAKVALEQAQNPQVKQIAQRIEQGHEQSMQRLRQAAQQAGVEISETPELMPVHEAKLAALKEKEGPAFDAAYLFGTAAGHRMGLLETSWAAENVQEQAIRDYAQQAERTLQQHQQQTEQLASRMSGYEFGSAGQSGSMDRTNRGNQDRPMPGMTPGQGGGMEGSDRDGM